MEHLFFNTELELEEASSKIFNALGILHSIEQGKSKNVLGEKYYVYSILGVDIKIELNSYDWDDRYKYMITVKENIFSAVQITQDNLEAISKLIADLLHRNLQMDIALEIAGELKIYHSPLV